MSTTEASIYFVECDLDVEPGQEARHEAQADESRKDKKTRGHDRQHSRQCHVLVGAGGSDSHQACRENRCRRGVSAYHECREESNRANRAIGMRMV